MEFKITNEQINEYISGELTGNNLIEFEKLLAKDEALQQQIKVHQQIDEVLSDNYFELNRFNEADYESEKERLNPILKKMNEKYFDETAVVENEKIFEQAAEIKIAENSTPENIPIIRKLWPFALLAAASILFFIFVSQQNDFSGTQLAAQNFEPYALQTTMETSGKLSTFDMAKKTYESNDYEKAIVLFDELLIEKPNAPTLLLAKGSAEFKLDKTDAAIKTFNQIDDKNTLFRSKAKWYLFLCYVKKEDKENAQRILNSISKETDMYKKASAIFNKINK